VARPAPGDGRVRYPAQDDDVVRVAQERSGLVCEAAWRQTQGVEIFERIADIPDWVGRGRESEWVGAFVVCGGGVVVAVVVVVEAGFGVMVLAGEAQQAGGFVGAGRGRDSPQCRACVPGQCSVGREEFGGGADEVGDDGVC